MTAPSAPIQAAETEEATPPSAPVRQRAHPVNAAGRRQRNQPRARAAEEYPFEKERFASLRPEKKTVTFAPGEVRPPGPVQKVIDAYNVIDKIEKKTKEAVVKAGQKARIFTVPEEISLLPPEENTDAFVV